MRLYYAFLMAILFFIVSCGSGLDRYYSYSFVEFSNPNDLIAKIKEFKKDSIKYDIFEYKENQKRSIDTISNNGLYNVQDINIFLPNLGKCVYCSIIPDSKNAYIYVIGYKNLKQETNDGIIYSNMLSDAIPISTKDNSKEIKKILKELELLLKKIGTLRNN